DARAEAEEAGGPRDRQGSRQGRYRAAPRDDQPDEPPEGQEALPAEAAVTDERLHEPAPPPPPADDAPHPGAEPSHSTDIAHTHDHGGHANGNGEVAAETSGNSHVEEIGSDQTEAP